MNNNHIIQISENKFKNHENSINGSLKNKLHIIYYNKYYNDNIIKIFGDKFVVNNKNRCKIIYKKKKYELKKNFKSRHNISVLKINLTGILGITNMSYMFHDCNYLKSLPDISKWNTSNVNDMSYMFYYCKSLSSLPDISKWNTSNVKSMSYMFSNCSSLLSLPNISKWNTSHLENNKNMYDGCSKLANKPKIKKKGILGKLFGNK